MYLLKVNINIRTKCEICSKLTKTPEQRQRCRSGVLIDNFEHVSHLVLVFLLLTLNRWMPIGRNLYLVSIYKPIAENKNIDNNTIILIKICLRNCPVLHLFSAFFRTIIWLICGKVWILFYFDKIWKQREGKTCTHNKKYNKLQNQKKPQKSADHPQIR